MSEDHLVGHCGKIIRVGEPLCFPRLEDDFCPGCPVNGREFLEEEGELEEEVIEE